MTDIIQEGWLKKEGGFVKSWKKRWFVLTSKQVSYYTERGGNLKGSIPISSITSVDYDPTCKKQPAFKIDCSQRTYHIVGDQMYEINAWVQSIRSVKEGKLQDEKPKQPVEQVKVQTEEPKPPAPAPQGPCLDDYIKISNIGSGSTCTVDLVREKTTGKLFAMKIISKRVVSDQERINQIITERDILLKAHHPFLISAHVSFQDEKNLYIVLDYAPGGELFKRLSEEGTFSEQRTKLYAAEILLGLKKLHKLNIIYRDLRPENILLDAQGHIKLTDFGLAKELQQDNTGTICGTPEYISPEMIQQLPYTMAVDWWAFGTLIYEMLTGLPPFYDENFSKMYRQIMESEIEFPSGMPEQAADLITKLLIKDPANRLGSGEGDAHEVMSHPWFSDINFDDVLELKTEPQWAPTLRYDADVSNFEKTNEGPAMLPDSYSGTAEKLQGFTCVNDSALDNI